MPETETPETDTFETLCAAIRDRTRTLGAFLARNYLEIADLVAAAKVAYDREYGTGPGKVGRRSPERVPRFVDAMGKEAGLSADMVGKYLRLSRRMTPEQRAALKEHPVDTFNGLLAIVTVPKVPKTPKTRTKAPRRLQESAPPSPPPERAPRLLLTENPPPPAEKEPPKARPDDSWIMCSARIGEQTTVTLDGRGYVVWLLPGEGDFVDIAVR